MLPEPSHGLFLFLNPEADIVEQEEDSFKIMPSLETLPKEMGSIICKHIVQTDNIESYSLVDLQIHALATDIPQNISSSREAQSGR